MALADLILKIAPETRSNFVEDLTHAGLDDPSIVQALMCGANADGIRRSCAPIRPAVLPSDAAHQDPDDVPCRGGWQPGALDDGSAPSWTGLSGR